jgi:cell wall-associated NlpC family hydrolase
MNATQAIQAAAKKYGIKDWRALAAVSHAESGLNPGAIGDGGSSFGLFQLHQGGALGNMPTSQARQYLDAYKNAEFAARKIREMGIHGLTGRDAIHAFVTKFERPANPAGEIERAYKWYTGQGKGLVPEAPVTTDPSIASAPSPMDTGGGQSTAFAQDLINRNAKQFKLPTITLPPTTPANVSFRIQPDGMDHTEIPPRGDLGSAITQAAKQFLGIPYKWGGTSAKTGFDCSGLMQTVFKQFGINIPRVSQAQFKGGQPVNANQARPGDLVFFSKAGDVHHVGLYIGGGKFLQAPRTGDVVKISKLSDRNDIAGFRRYAK